MNKSERSSQGSQEHPQNLLPPQPLLTRRRMLEIAGVSVGAGVLQYLNLRYRHPRITGSTAPRTEPTPPEPTPTATIAPTFEPPLTPSTAAPSMPPTQESSTTAAEPVTPSEVPQIQWQFSSIDTMKDSRDRARSGVSDAEIHTKTTEIHMAGATHIALGTPYDEEFVPFMKRWVESAREKGLKVWFRGNFSGSEGWFNYPATMTPDQHIEATRAFILAHPELFEAGDIFTPAPEPENAKVIGDPRNSTDDGAAFEAFLVRSYAACQESFTQIGKQDVKYGYFSMNGDVAALLTPSTVPQIGNVIVIDHYIANPEAMGSKIEQVKQRYPGVEVVVGEFGIVDHINGELTPQEQAAFLEQVVQQMKDGGVKGVNFWPQQGGPLEPELLNVVTAAYTSNTQTS